MSLRQQVVVSLSLGVLLSVAAQAAEPTCGWRGNRTGLWPDARPALHWHRIARGAQEGLRAQANLPVGADAKSAALVEKGLIRDWLVLGPFAVEDSIRDLDHDALEGEPRVEPADAQQAGGKHWMAAKVPPDDPLVFGQVKLAWLDVAEVVGFQQNQLAYAHTWLFLPRGGPARIVVDHETVLDRWWPIPAQETLTYAPPLADGDRIYLRGEAYLYCLAED